MTIQEDTALAVLQAIRGATAVTLEGGYAITGGAGGRTLFEPARMEEVRRNDAGRCTHAVARYRDGSWLTFTWHPGHGARYARNGGRAHHAA